MANGKDKTYYEIEINRVKTALEKTQSEYLKKDYTKLTRLIESGVFNG
jgi:predicted lipid-binding transport protein (Tim44 family)